MGSHAQLNINISLPQCKSSGLQGEFQVCSLNAGLFSQLTSAYSSVYSVTGFFPWQTLTPSSRFTANRPMLTQACGWTDISVEQKIALLGRVLMEPLTSRAGQME